MDKIISTLEVVKDYFTFRLNESSNLNKKANEYFADLSSQEIDCKSKIFNTIRMLSYESELKNHKTYDSYISYILDKLDDISKDDFYFLILKLQDIANLLFSDNIIDWGRIISLISFVSYFSFKLAWIHKDLSQASTCACKLIEWLTSFLTCKCGMWIECSGGWVGFFKKRIL